MNKINFLEKVKQIVKKDKSSVALYNEISRLAMQEIQFSPKADRNIYYLSMEFLIGRLFYNNLLELGVLKEVEEIFKSNGMDINDLEEIEDDALGNGGLGRLAACFLDSGAHLGLPIHGYGIRYKYGLFKQSIENGYQVEYKDDWQSFGDPWSVRREDKALTIDFADMKVRAVPYYYPLIGKSVNALVLFEAEGEGDASKISEYLYPDDSDEAGKLLRLRQEYFFSAGAIRTLVLEHIEKYGQNFDNFASTVGVQLNDTHPVLAIAELIRILVNEHGLAFDKAVKISNKVFAYTNHTILPEALERWSESLIEKILPEILKVLVMIDEYAKVQFKNNNVSQSDINSMQIFDGHSYSMANLAVYVSHAVNGVAKIHSEIIKENLFNSAYRYTPDKFQNKTNGITQRRWLELCNEGLSNLLDKTISSDWRKDLTQIKNIENFADDQDFINDFIAVKEQNKKKLAHEILRKQNISLHEDAIIFAQIKRLHEYKRQLMTAFAILKIYYRIKHKVVENLSPMVFLFGAKSAPGYRRAKGIIKFINEVAKLVNNDSDTNKILQVVFLENYNVSYAEKIVSGSDVSLQVSTAGLEASGTGNMKFMLNGCVTCGTMDGANIEIVEYAGKENNYIFGATVDEIEALKKNGYDPNAIIAECKENKFAINTLIDGTFSDGKTRYFDELYSSLTADQSWHKADHYFIMQDLNDFVRSIMQINKDYKDKKSFAKKQILNTANSSYFSSDRTITEYAEQIWNI